MRNTPLPPSLKRPLRTALLAAVCAFAFSGASHADGSEMPAPTTPTPERKVLSILDITNLPPSLRPGATPGLSRLEDLFPPLASLHEDLRKTVAEALPEGSAPTSEVGVAKLRVAMDKMAIQVNQFLVENRLNLDQPDRFPEAGTAGHQRPVNLSTRHALGYEADNNTVKRFSDSVQNIDLRLSEKEIAGLLGTIVQKSTGGDARSWESFKDAIVRYDLYIASLILVGVATGNNLTLTLPDHLLHQSADNRLVATWYRSIAQIGTGLKPVARSGVRMETPVVGTALGISATPGKSAHDQPDQLSIEAEVGDRSVLTTLFNRIAPGKINAAANIQGAYRAASLEPSRCGLFEANVNVGIDPTHLLNLKNMNAAIGAAYHIDSRLNQSVSVNGNVNAPAQGLFNVSLNVDPRNAGPSLNVRAGYRRSIGNLVESYQRAVDQDAEQLRKNLRDLEAALTAHDAASQASGLQQVRNAAARAKSVQAPLTKRTLAEVRLPKVNPESEIANLSARNRAQSWLGMARVQLRSSLRRYAKSLEHLRAARNDFDGVPGPLDQATLSKARALAEGEVYNVPDFNIQDPR